MTKAAKPGLVKSCVQTVARWAGIPVDAGDGIAWNLGDARILAAANASGQNVNEATALSLSAVWACVSLLSDTISTLPLGFYYRKRNGERIDAEDHPLYRVLKRQPNVDMTSAQFIGATIANMLLRGVAYWEKDIIAGRVTGLTFLPSGRVSVTLVNGVEEFYFTDYTGKRRHIPKSRLVRIPAFSVDGIHGLSAICYGAQCFGAAMAAEQAASGTFNNGLLPSTVFTYPTALRKEQRDAAREAITNLSGAVNAGKPVILEAGVTVSSVGINPQDAQLLESRAFSVEEICSWFRVQPFMIGRAADGQTNWGTGIEQQMIGFITFTLGPWLRRLEQAVEKDLLTPEEQGKFYAEFSIEGLLRGDSAARREFYASALQNGWMNRNQVRALENYPPIEGGDVFTVQSNLIPIDKLGAPADPTSAFKAWLTLKGNHDG